MTAGGGVTAGDAHASDGGLPAGFSCYGEAMDWLYGTQWFGIKLGLGNISRLLDSLRLPVAGQRVVHVAGTNGKGSVCAFADALLRASGLRTGLFTSPHLVSYCERMRINGSCIPEAEVATRLGRLRKVVEGWNHHPTFFELTVALALDWFRDAGAEVIVLETGMGGRLDATNALLADVSVITPIALDHQKWLGDTLEEIASEKAGILKPGVAAISSAQSPGVAAVLRATANRTGAPFRFLSDGDVDRLDGLVLGLDGPHQRHNAALAVAAVEALGIRVDVGTLADALAGTRWQARFERFHAGRVIIDGAHNGHAAAALASTWKAAFGGEKAHMIFGAVADKDAGAMLRALAPIAARIDYVPFASPRAVDPAELSARDHPDPALPYQIAGSLEGALAAALEAGSRVLITGSLFLAGHAISVLQKDSIEESAQ